VKPVALSKAESLRRHVAYLGAGMDGFVLSITLGEAYELLDYLVEQYPTSELLRHDVAHAKESCDPWPVLHNFDLLGFPIMPASELH
jgi:hypothetical protein